MSSTSASLTVVMPVLNERATLRRAVKRLLETELPVPLEVLIVDDGSTDGCLDTIADLVESDEVRVVRHQRNQGKGAAVRTGIREASGSILTILDADLEYDPADYADLLQPMLAGEARVVYGTRQFGAHTAYSFWYVMGNKALAFVASFLYDTWLTDVETCFKMADTAIWRRLDLRSDGFEIEVEFTGKVLRSGERIFEQPISYKARGREEGKKLQWTDGVRALWVLARIRARGR
jgi:glycosyltransferase involved in cell wall biosynthesis